MGSVVGLLGTGLLAGDGARTRPGWPTRSTRSRGRSGQALGSTLAVTFIAANLDPATGLPRDVAFTRVALTGAVSTAAVMLVAAAGLWADRRGPTDARPTGPTTGIEAATAAAGEWPPVSGIR